MFNSSWIKSHTPHFKGKEWITETLQITTSTPRRIDYSFPVLPQEILSELKTDRCDSHSRSFPGGHFKSSPAYIKCWNQARNLRDIQCWEMLKNVWNLIGHYVLTHNPSLRDLSWTHNKKIWEMFWLDLIMKSITAQCSCRGTHYYRSGHKPVIAVQKAAQWENVYSRSLYICVSLFLSCFPFPSFYRHKHYYTLDLWYKAKANKMSQTFVCSACVCTYTKDSERKGLDKNNMYWLVSLNEP